MWRSSVILGALLLLVVAPSASEQKAMPDQDFLERLVHNGGAQFPLRLQSPSSGHTLRSQVTALEQWLPQPFSPILYHPQQEWVVCVSPKTGCTALRRYLYWAEGVPLPKRWVDLYKAKHIGSVVGLTSLSQVRRGQYPRMIMAAKHPLLRLESGFADKWEQTHSKSAKFRSTYGVLLNSTYDGRPAADVFDHFITELLRIEPTHRNSHFKPVAYNCGNHLLRYDGVMDFTHQATTAPLPFHYETSFAGR
jgi:Sulfotransferase family